MDLVFLLSQIKDLLAELNSYRPLDATTEARVMQKLRLDWNYHSNHLEGGQLTYGETKALLLFGITAQGKPLNDHLEVKGHDEAIRFIEDMIKQNRPMSEVFIRNLHKLILKESYKKEARTAEGGIFYAYNSRWKVQRNTQSCTYKNRGDVLFCFARRNACKDE